MEKIADSYTIIQLQISEQLVPSIDLLTIQD